jgi:hypothetical protein
MQCKDWGVYLRQGRAQKNKGQSRPLSFLAKRSDLSDQFYVYGVQAFFTVLKIKLHVIVFFDLVNQPAGVNKSFFIGVIMFDKTKTFVCVKELYGARCFVVHH